MLRLLIFLLLPASLHAQASFEPVRIYFNPVGDSIGRNTKLYHLGVEAQFGDGSHKPLDSSWIRITTDHGRMNGHEWVPPVKINFQKVHFHAALKMNPENAADIMVWMKRSNDSLIRNPDNIDLPVVPKHRPGKHP